MGPEMLDVIAECLEILLALELLSYHDKNYLREIGGNLSSQKRELIERALAALEEEKDRRSVTGGSDA